jgi:O-antigen/teichoic acid export membrane protein
VAGVRLDRTGEDMRPRWSATSSRELARVGRSGLTLNLSQSLAFRADRYLVGAFLGPAAVGTYSVAATLPELVRLVPYSLSEIVFRRSTADPGYSPALHARLRQQCLVIVGALSALAAVTAPIVVPAVFTESFRDAVGPLVVLAAAEVGIGSFYLDARRLSGQGRIGDAARAAIAGLIVVLLGDVVLIPSFELMGAAAASLAGYTCMAVIARRKLRA